MEIVHVTQPYLSTETVVWNDSSRMSKSGWMDVFVYMKIEKGTTIAYKYSYANTNFGGLYTFFTFYPFLFAFSTNTYEFYTEYDFSSYLLNGGKRKQKKKKHPN